MTEKTTSTKVCPHHEHKQLVFRITFRTFKILSSEKVLNDTDLVIILTYRVKKAYIMQPYYNVINSRHLVPWECYANGATHVIANYICIKESCLASLQTSYALARKKSTCVQLLIIKTVGDFLIHLPPVCIEIFELMTEHRH